MDLEKIFISISTMSGLVMCQMTLGLHCLKCNRLGEIALLKWLDAGKLNVNYINQKLKWSGFGCRASKQLRLPSGGLSDANTYQDI